jgi:hypothetical protein
MPVEEFVAFVGSEIVFGAALRAFSFGAASIFQLPLKSNRAPGAAEAQK